MEPGVNLYSKKILIENKPKDLLPDWLRFIKGVVDSEDLPLSISREKSQDTFLLKRIKDVLTRKIIKYLDDQSKNNKIEYHEFYLEYNYFLKEGICHDSNFIELISKLLRFESSFTTINSTDNNNVSSSASKTNSNEINELISFDDYISRSNINDKNIYYLIAPNREAALNSPYYETFKKHNKEILFLYNSIDDFVMSNIKTFNGRTLVSAEDSSINLDSNSIDKKNDTEIIDEIKSDDKKDETIDNKITQVLSEDESKELCDWLTSILGDKKVRQVKITNRLSDSPAIVTDHQSGALRKMMKMLVSIE